MKFFNVISPYSALIKANTKESAMKIYIEEVANDEGTLNKDMKEISIEHAVKAYIHKTGFEQGYFFQDEILNGLKDKEEGVIVMDGSLL